MDALYKQMDYLAERVVNVEENMIDPREFGRLESEVKNLQTEVAGLRADVKSLLELANQSKGGFWMGMAVASLIGGLASWIAKTVLFK
jgi:hypothetical protein